jgi:hypothetical protein
MSLCCRVCGRGGRGGRGGLRGRCASGVGGPAAAQQPPADMDHEQDHQDDESVEEETVDVGVDRGDMVAGHVAQS